jgi:acyl-CoA thioesterase-1
MVLASAFACVGVAFSTLPGFAQQTAAPSCTAPADLTALGKPLTRTAQAIASGGPLTIVAVGSSSTAGAGASSPDASYPKRLEAELKARFPGVALRVINRGVNGDEARQMLARFDNEVLAEHPDLVLWQVGTNAVLRDLRLAGEAPQIRRGIKRLQASRADIVLIEPQYAPKVIIKPDAPGMVALLRQAAADADIPVFRRWDIMRRWHDVDNVPFESVLSPDGLHQNDWSYACVAKLLAISIADAARSPAMASARAAR